MANEIGEAHSVVVLVDVQHDIGSMARVFFEDVVQKGRVLESPSCRPLR